MLVQITSLVDQSVWCIETDSVIGRTSDIVVDPKNGQVLAFSISVSLFGVQKVLSVKDIIEIKTDFLVVQKENILVQPGEIIKVAEVLKKNIKVLGNWARTDKGEWLGKVEDLLIDTETFSIIKYYIRGTAFGFRTTPLLGTFKENRIISAENIIKIGPRAIIVKGEAKEKEAKATVPEPA